jgi:hypothetical protein
MCWRAAHSEFRRCRDTYEASSTVSRAAQGRLASSIRGLYRVAGGARGCMPQWVYLLLSRWSVPRLAKRVGEQVSHCAAGTGSVTGWSSSNAAAPQGPEHGSSLRHRNISRASRRDDGDQEHLRCLAKSWDAFAMPTMPRSLSHTSKRMQATPSRRSIQRTIGVVIGWQVRDRIEIKKTPSLQTHAGLLVVEVELRISSRCCRTTP